jgi:hypothetical protein
MLNQSSRKANITSELLLTNLFKNLHLIYTQRSPLESSLFEDEDVDAMRKGTDPQKLDT